MTRAPGGASRGPLVFPAHLPRGGPAVVVRCVDADGPDNTLVKQLAGIPGESRVIVVDVAGVLTNAVLGDLIASDAALL